MVLGNNKQQQLYINLNINNLMNYKKSRTPQKVDFETSRLFYEQV